MNSFVSRDNSLTGWTGRRSLSVRAFNVSSVPGARAAPSNADVLKTSDYFWTLLWRPSQLHPRYREAMLPTIPGKMLRIFPPTLCLGMDPPSGGFCRSNLGNNKNNFHPRVLETSSLSCEAPVPRASKHHQNSTRREGRKKEICGGRGKKREILGCPTLRGPHYRDQPGLEQDWPELDWPEKAAPVVHARGSAGGPAQLGTGGSKTKTKTTPTPTHNTHTQHPTPHNTLQHITMDWLKLATTGGFWVVT